MDAFLLGHAVYNILLITKVIIKFRLILFDKNQIRPLQNKNTFSKGMVSLRERQCLQTKEFKRGIRISF